MRFSSTGHEDKHGEAGFSNSVLVNDTTAGLRYLITRAFNGRTPTRAPTPGALARFHAPEARAQRLTWALRSLWRPHQSDEARPRVRVADTALVRDGRPALWLFTSLRTGRVLRRSPDNASAEELRRLLARNVARHRAEQRGCRFAFVLRVASVRGARTLLLPPAAVPRLCDPAAGPLWARALAVQAFVPAERDRCLSTFCCLYEVASDGSQRTSTRKRCKHVVPLGRGPGGEAGGDPDGGAETDVELLSALRAEDRELQRYVKQAFGCTASEVGGEDDFRCLEARLDRQLGQLTRDLVGAIQRNSGETVVQLTAEFVLADDGPVLTHMSDVFTLADDEAKSAALAQHREDMAVYRAVQDLCEDPLLEPPPAAVRPQPVALREKPPAADLLAKTLPPRKPPLDSIALARTDSGHLFPSTISVVAPEHRVPGCGGDFCDWNRGRASAAAGGMVSIALKSIMLGSAELRRATAQREAEPVFVGAAKSSSGPPKRQLADEDGQGEDDDDDDDGRAPYIPDTSGHDSSDVLGHGKREITALKDIAFQLRRFRANESGVSVNPTPMLAVPACRGADEHTRAFYNQVLSQVSAAHYYTHVKVCANCFRVYSHLDRRRDAVLQDYSVALRSTKAAQSQEQPGVAVVKGRWLQFATPSRKALRAAALLAMSGAPEAAAAGDGAAAEEPAAAAAAEEDEDVPQKGDGANTAVQAAKKTRPDVVYDKELQRRSGGGQRQRSLNIGPDGQRRLDVKQLVGRPDAQLWPAADEQEQLFVRPEEPLTPADIPARQLARSAKQAAQADAALARSRSRPGSASRSRSRPGSASRSRPGSASRSRPGSAARARPGSARPGSAARSRPLSATASRGRIRPSSARPGGPHEMQNKRAPWREPAKKPPAPLLNLAEAFLAQPGKLRDMDEYLP